MNSYYAIAIWAGMALLASLVSIRLAIPALAEIVVGAVAGNLPGIQQHITQTSVVTFLASAGSLVLTFLAGAEIDPVSLRGHWKASVSIGVISFLLPFLGAFAFCALVLRWPLHAAEIGGIALSTTSVAVVYAVMVETGLNRHDLGKLILAACFVTDLGTVLALGGLFASYGWLLAVFAAVSAVTLLLLPRLLRLAITYVGHRVTEPEIKLLLVVLFGLGGLAAQAGSEAVLPAYVAGLVVAGVFLHDRVLMDRLRSIAFALLTPFFFLRAGTLISAPALVTGAGAIAVLLLVKLATKMAGVWPVAAAFKLPRRERTYTTLLMATGLTFGSIAALYGLTHHLIDKAQYTELVTVVILSAFVPTLIAQQLFRPVVTDTEKEEALGAEDLSVLSRAGAAQGAAERHGEHGRRDRRGHTQAPRLARADAAPRQLGVECRAETGHRGHRGQGGAQGLRRPGRQRGERRPVPPAPPQREIAGQDEQPEQPRRRGLQQEITGVVGEHRGDAGVRAGAASQPPRTVRPGVAVLRPGRGEERVALRRQQYPGDQPGPADRHEPRPADQGGGQRQPAGQRQRRPGQAAALPGDPGHRAHPPHRLRLRLRFGQPGRHAFGHRVAQVRFYLAQGVPDLARAAAQRDQQAIQVVLDGIAGRLGGVAGHASAPRRRARHTVPAAGMPSTRATDPLNSRHWSACSARAAAPAGVSR
jgi:Kef-type K+ transport system membrane component KefB